MIKERSGEPKQSVLGDLVMVNRREVIAIGAGGIVLVGSFSDQALAEADGSADGGSEGNSGAEQQQRFADRTDANAPRTEQRPEEQNRQEVNIETLLGSDSRSPTCGTQNLTSYQSYATGTRETPPDRASVAAGQYFSDGFARKLMSDAKDLLATALRAPSKLPEGVTISIGGEFKFPEQPQGVTIGAPGRTPFFLPMVDVSNKGIGQSRTLGVGTTDGVFLTVASMKGEQSWSVGYFLGSSKAVVMDSINLSESIRQRDLVIEEAVLMSGGKVELEIGGEMRVGHEVYETFVKVLGPLSDYRNFQDPLLGF